MRNLIRSDLQDFVAYQSARDQAQQGKIWLNANESPYELEEKINRYPKKQSEELVKKIAEINKVDHNQILVTRGSDEAIDLLIRLFCEARKDAIMICPPTYGMYSVSARLQGAEVIEAPLNKDFQLDIENMIKQWNEKIKIIFICSPNNPTGQQFNKNDVLFLCKTFYQKSMIVIDEAYIDFAEDPSYVTFLNENAHLVILRTFSKAYGLAGMRCGYLLAQKELIEWLLKIIAPYPLPTLIVKKIIQHLSDENKLKIKNQIEYIKSERERLLTQLKKISFIKTMGPSQANFILIKSDIADRVMQYCSEKGIILRSLFDKKGLENCIRITVGLAKENDLLINTLRDLI